LDEIEKETYMRLKGIYLVSDALAILFGGDQKMTKYKGVLSEHMARNTVLIIVACCTFSWCLRIDSNWVDLFNGVDFSGWYAYVVPPGQSAATYDNPADDPGNNFEIIDNVIVHDVDPDVSQTSAYVMTNDFYSRYHFRVEYKLGEDCARGVSYCKNSGLMYCMIQDGIWGVGIESNMYWDWPTAIADLGGVSFDEVRPNFGNFSGGADEMNQYTVDGEWNLMEVIVWSDSAVQQYVNGHLGGWAVGVNKPNGDPLTEGRIGLQAEGNDVSFRNMQIRDIDEPIKYWGCTDTSAENYEEEATHDDSSCIIRGCIDPTAANYDSTATVDDGSCITSVPRITFGERPYGTDISSGKITVYVLGRYQIIIRNIKGKAVWIKSGTGSTTHNLTLLKNAGVYFVTVTAKNMRISKRICIVN
jgi:hypothetical protein